MEIVQKEKNGIVCVTIKGRMGDAQTPEFEKTINAIVKSDQTRLLFVGD